MIDIYALTVGALDFIRQILMDLKGQINLCTAITDGFTTSLSSVDCSAKPKNKETSELNYSIDSMDQTDICRIFQPTEMAQHSSQKLTELSLK